MSMNGPLIDAAKKILKRRYDVECSEPFAGVDRFRRTTGNSVAQVDLQETKDPRVFKLHFCGFCYDNDEKYEEDKQFKTTETTNPKDIAEIIDEYLSRVETNLAILVKQHRPYSKKKRIMSMDEAKEVLKKERLLVEKEDYKRDRAWIRRNLGHRGIEFDKDGFGYRDGYPIIAIPHEEDLTPYVLKVVSKSKKLDPEDIEKVFNGNVEKLNYSDQYEISTIEIPDLEYDSLDKYLLDMLSDLDSVIHW